MALNLIIGLAGGIGSGFLWALAVLCGTRNQRLQSLLKHFSNDWQMVLQAAGGLLLVILCCVVFLGMPTVSLITLIPAFLVSWGLSLNLLASASAWR